MTTRYSKRCATWTLALSLVMLVNYQVQPTSAKSLNGDKPQALKLAQAKPGTLSLQALKNLTVPVPDLACGDIPVQLRDGRGQRQGIEVRLGSAVFGTFPRSQTPLAVAHIAYEDEALGWMHELIFVTREGAEPTVVASYGLDDREHVQSLKLDNGELTLYSVNNESSERKLTHIKVSGNANGCSLSSATAKNPLSVALVRMAEPQP